MAFDVSWIYQIIDKYSRPARKIISLTRKMKDAAVNTGKRFKGMGKKLLNLKSIIGTIVTAAIIAFPIKKAIEFEDRMIDVQKVLTFKSKDHFQKFREGIFKTALFLGKLPKNIADIAIQGGKLGVLPKNLQKFIDLAARTATAFDIVEGVAAAAIGSIKTKLGLTIKETGGLMDAINFLADNTATSGKRVIEVVSRTVGTMKTIKMPPQLVAGWAAFADQLEVSPELAASGLNMMVVKMMKMPGMMRKLLKDPSNAIKDFLGRFQKMSDVKRARMVFRKFGLEAGRFVLKAVNSMDLLDKTLGLVGKNGKFVGSMMKELEKKLAGTKTAVGKLAAVTDFVAITIGDALLPIIKELTPPIVKMAVKLREFIKANPQIVKMVVLFGAILVTMMAIGVVIGALAWGIGILLSPVGLIVAAVIGIAAAFVWVYSKSEKFRTGLTAIWDALKPVRVTIGKITDAFVKLFEKMGGGQATADVIGETFLLILNGISSTILYVHDQIIGLYNTAKMVYEFAQKIFSGEITKQIQTKLDVSIAKPLAEIGTKIGQTLNEETKGLHTKLNDFAKFLAGSNGSVSAENAKIKNELKASIVVSANPGTKVESVNFESTDPGMLGLNMAR